MKYTAHNIFTLTLLLSATPFFAVADSTVVSNISISSNSGGNIAKGGEVVTSDTKSSVRIQTIVNGESTVDIEEEHADNSFIHVEEVTYVTDNEKPHTEHTITVLNDTVPAENAFTKPVTGTSKQSATYILFSHIFISHLKTKAYVLPHLF